jgi:endonuclease/exonuclease/phosphatase family metal-dependent hydrolase
MNALDRIATENSEALDIVKNHSLLRPQIYTFKLLCANVHGWTSADRKYMNHGKVRDLMEAIEPTVICLQEVKNCLKGSSILKDHADINKLNKFLNNDTNKYLSKMMQHKQKHSSKKVKKTTTEETKEQRKMDKEIQKVDMSLNGKYHYCFFPALDPSFGNGLLFSKLFPQSSTKHVRLEGSAQETRVACAVEINYEALKVVVVNMHLDATAEVVRMKQIDKILNWINTTWGPTVPHILCGDLNALSHWNENDDVSRKNANLEKASNEVYQFLRKRMYFDVEVPDEKKWPRKTCEHDTRVDYILLSKELKDCCITTTPSLCLHLIDSDHDALSLKLELTICKKNQEY